MKLATVLEVAEKEGTAAVLDPQSVYEVDEPLEVRVSLVGQEGTRPKIRWTGGDWDGPILVSVANKPTFANFMLHGSKRAGGLRLESGFVSGAVLRDASFYKIRGNAVESPACWGAEFLRLWFGKTEGQALVLAQHNAGHMRTIVAMDVHAGDKPGIEIIGTTGHSRYENVLLELIRTTGPAMRVSDGQAAVVGVRCEGGKEGLSASSAVELLNCTVCSVQYSLIAFQRGCHPSAAVNVTGGKSNVIENLCVAYRRHWPAEAHPWVTDTGEDTAIRNVVGL